MTAARKPVRAGRRWIAAAGIVAVKSPPVTLYGVIMFAASSPAATISGAQPSVELLVELDKTDATKSKLRSGLPCKVSTTDCAPTPLDCNARTSSRVKKADAPARPSLDGFVERDGYSGTKFASSIVPTVATNVEAPPPPSCASAGMKALVYCVRPVASTSSNGTNPHETRSSPAESFSA